MKFTGIVQRHAGRGKKLGFPTANLEAPSDAEDGIYLATVGPMELPALVFVGRAETFGETKRSVEVYILDFEEDIYGQEIEVNLLKRLRENRKFETEQDLIEQMKKDEVLARDFFSKYPENI